MEFTIREEEETSNQQEWQALSISSFSTQWGKVQIHDKCLVFISIPTPESVKSNNMIPSLV